MSDEWFTLEELEAHRIAQNNGASILRNFVLRAKAYNDQLRHEAKEQIRLGLPYITDTLVFDAWYVDDDKIQLLDHYGDAELELPLDALTGELAPEAHVQSLWDAIEEERKEYRKLREQKDREQLRRLMAKYPDEVNHE